jgi:hypothetical protein
MGSKAASQKHHEEERKEKGQRGKERRNGA